MLISLVQLLQKPAVFSMGFWSAVVRADRKRLYTGYCYFFSQKVLHYDFILHGSRSLLLLLLLFSSFYFLFCLPGLILGRFGWV